MANNFFGTIASFFKQAPETPLTEFQFRQFAFLTSLEEQASKGHLENPFPLMDGEYQNRAKQNPDLDDSQRQSPSI